MKTQPGTTLIQLVRDAIQHDDLAADRSRQRLREIRGTFAHQHVQQLREAGHQAQVEVIDAVDTPVVEIPGTDRRLLLITMQWAADMTLAEAWDSCLSLDSLERLEEVSVHVRGADGELVERPQNYWILTVIEVLELLGRESASYDFLVPAAWLPNTSDDDEDSWVEGALLFEDSQVSFEPHPLQPGANEPLSPHDRNRLSWRIDDESVVLADWSQSTVDTGPAAHLLLLFPQQDSSLNLFIPPRFGDELAEVLAQRYLVNTPNGRLEGTAR